MSRTKFSTDLVFRHVDVFLNDYLTCMLRRSPETVNAYKTALSLLRRFALDKKSLRVDNFCFRDLNLDFLLEFRIWLVNFRKQKPQSANHRFCLVRNYIKYCSQQDLSLAALLLELREVPNLRYDKPSEEALSEDAISLLLKMPRNSRKGTRDRLFMILLYETAARISELLSLRLANISLDTDHPHLHLSGKGRKQRVIPLTDNVCDHLRQYLEIYHPTQNQNKYLFYHIIKGNEGRLSHDCVAAFIDKYARLAHEIDFEFPEHIHSHLFRKSRATHLSRNGVSLPIISRFLGHSEITTTMVYIKPDQQIIKEALERNASCHEFTDEELQEYEDMRASLLGIR